jgi:chromosome segregation ATPase
MTDQPIHLHRDFNTTFCDLDAANVICANVLADATCEECRTAFKKQHEDANAEVEELKLGIAMLEKTINDLEVHAAELKPQITENKSRIERLRTEAEAAETKQATLEGRLVGTGVDLDAGAKKLELQKNELQSAEEKLAQLYKTYNAPSELDHDMLDHETGEEAIA